MQSLIIASQNAHKVDEFRQMLKSLPCDVRPLAKGLPESPETADTFELIALQKAMHYGAFCDGYVLADDSGLSVPALHGEPGIFSARYAGRHGDDAANRRKLLERLRTVPEMDRQGVFVCALAAWNVKSAAGFVVRGEVHGTILHEERGSGGFGYDSLFYVPELGCTFAEVSADEKNRHSHRAKAVQSLLRLMRGGEFDAPLRGERQSPPSP